MASPETDDSAGDAVGLLRRVDVAALDGRRRIHVAVWAESKTPSCRLAAIVPLVETSPGPDPTRYASAAALSLVNTALIVAAYQRVLPRGGGDTVGHQPVSDRLEGSALPAFGDDPTGDLQR